MMKTKLQFVFFSLVVIQLFMNQTFGQTNKIISSPGKRLFINTNLTHYNVGDSILFKAYYHDYEPNNATSISNKLYLAVLDQDGLEVANGIFPVKNGQADGAIRLSDFLTEGNYLLIACTGRMKNATPEEIFSKVIEIKNPEKQEFSTSIHLTDTLYKPGSQLTANIRFTGKEGNPVAVSFNCQLAGASGEIFTAKSKSGKDGTAVISILLPLFKSEERIKLFVAVSYKGMKRNSGIVLPTIYDKITKKVNALESLPDTGNGRLNIGIQTTKQQYGPDERILADIIVTDDKGVPVVANLSVSASNIEDSGVESYLQWSQIVAGKEDSIPQILTSDMVNHALSEPVFNIGLRELFAGYLSMMTEYPGRQFNVQEKNDPERLKSKKETKALQKEEGYPPQMSIFDILRQIKPYWMANDKIVFTSSGISSLNNMDGALIIIDGINSGTDSRILNNIPVSDIARITASTNSMDIQRYSGMNNVGIIEIVTKKGGNMKIKEVRSDKNNDDSLIWQPDIMTNNTGKSSVSFLNKKPSSVIISVAGITSGGLAGSSEILTGHK